MLQMEFSIRPQTLKRQSFQKWVITNLEFLLHIHVEPIKQKNHTINFTTIAEGIHSKTNSYVAITVTDIHGNVSNPLNIPEFEIDITPPVVLLATADNYAFKTDWNTETPQIKITSDVGGMYICLLFAVSLTCIQG